MAEFKQTLSLILDELYITDYYIRRLDFSINTIVTFDEIYKIACYFKELYAVHIREDNSFRTNVDVGSPGNSVKLTFKTSVVAEVPMHFMGIHITVKKPISLISYYTPLF